MELEDDKIHSVNIPSLEQMNAEINPANKAGSLGGSFRKSGKVSPAPTEEGSVQNAAADGKQPKSKYMSKTTIFVLIQVLVLLLIAAFLISSLVIRTLKHKHVGGLQIWKWCLFAMSVLIGFSLVLWVYWPIMFIIERAFALEQEVIYFMYGLRKSGAFFVWWIWVLLMWVILLRQQIEDTSPKASKVLRITTQTLISLTVGSLAWVLLTIALRLLSVKCRFNRYIDKIQGVAFELDVLRSLAGKPLSDGGDGLSCYPCCQANNKKHNVGTADHQLQRIYTLNSDNLNFLNWDDIFDHVQESLELSTLKGIKNISTDKQASKVASYVFGNVLRNNPQSEYITKDGLSRFIYEDKIPLVLGLFNAQESEKIERKAFTDWVIKVNQNRKLLFQALNDNKTATKQLSILLRMVLVIMGLTGWLLWIDVLTTKLLAAFLTTAAGGVFIFGDSVKNTFQSIIFVFVMHPFDIGDKCLIENTQMVVDQMNILTTVFVNPKNEITYYPNYVLAGKIISNTSRSSLLHDSVQFFIDKATSVEMIATLRHNIEQVLERSSLVVEGSNNQDGINLTLQFSFPHNVDNSGETPTSRRSEAILKLMEILQNMKIPFSFPTSGLGVFPG